MRRGARHASANRSYAMGAFVYRADVGPGLVEHEYDHVLLARLAPGSEPAPDPEEVGEVAWCTADEVRERLARDADRFAAWAPTVLTMALYA